MSPTDVDRYAFRIAHDFRAPLRAIEGYADAMREDCALDADATWYLERIASAAGDLDGLLNEFLRFSRIVTAEPRLVDFEPGRAAEAVVGALDGGVHVRIEGPFPRVHGDVALFSAALSELVKNALTYVPAGATPEVRVFARERADRVDIVVADRGIGIAPEHHAGIFEIFGRLHSMEQYPGRGVGLTLAAIAARKQGASISLASRPGQGSAFALHMQGAT